MRSRRLAGIAVAAVATSLLLGGCSSTVRPEGVVERWLLALNQGKAGRPGLYAPDEFSERILPGWRTEDPGQLDTIEVGKGSEPYHVPTLDVRPHALVPYRVVLGTGAIRRGVAVLAQESDRWVVITLGPPNPDLRVPSDGGPPIASPSANVWLAALGVAIALSLISVGLMTVVGRKPEQLTVYPTDGADAPG